MPKRTLRPAPAFTLVELMIALAILALLAAAAAFSFAKPLHRARAAEAVAQIRYLDASTRDLARRFGRDADLHFDLADGAIARRDRRGDFAGESTFRAAIASPITLESVRTPGRQYDYGDVTVPVTPLGLSDTYAVKLAGPEGTQWVVFSGLAGESTVLTDDAKVDAIFAQVLSPRRGRDAD